MSGQFACVGPRQAAPVVYQGLRRQQQHGYEMAGIAVIYRDYLERCRTKGKLHELKILLEAKLLDGSIAIGSTQVANIGKPSVKNSQPPIDCTRTVATISGGTIRNWHDHRRKLEETGHHFTSETDTEVIVHLLEHFLNQGTNLATAVRFTFRQIEGDHVLVAMSSREPDKLVAACIGCTGGLYVGLRDGEAFIAPRVPAMPRYIESVVFLDSWEMAIVTRWSARYLRLDNGTEIKKKAEAVIWRQYPGQCGCPSSNGRSC